MSPLEIPRITYESVERLVFMNYASLRASPVTLLRVIFSDPARSTRVNEPAKDALFRCVEFMRIEQIKWDLDDFELQCVCLSILF